MTTPTRCQICWGVQGTPPPQPDGYSYCDCRPNPKYWRTAKITVQVSRTWLTSDGDFPEDEGWVEIEDALTKSLIPTEVKFIFEEWDGEPEQQEVT